MTPAELERVNAFRALRGRPALDCSPGVRFLSYGKNKDGYWDYEMFAKQVVDFMDAFDVLHPEWQLMLEAAGRPPPGPSVCAHLTVVQE